MGNSVGVQNSTCEGKKQTEGDKERTGRYICKCTCTWACTNI